MVAFARSYAIRRDRQESQFKRPRAASQPYGPGAICAAYGWPTGIVVEPLTIVIGELGGRFYPSDVALWAAEAGMPVPVIDKHLLPGADDSPSNADGEVALDWQRAAEVFSYMTGLAARILLIYGGNTETGMPGVMNYANSLVGVGAGSWSWGSPEDQQSSFARQAMDAAAQAAIFPWTAASGDNDAGDGTGSPDTDMPASSPWFTGCGGTSRPPQGVETVWNNGNGSGTGGGFSKLYQRPTWQPVNAQGTGRMVPDLACVADPDTGYSTLINGAWDVIGGTSAVAPLMAGFFAVVNGARLKAGLPMIAQANPVLWSNQSCFYDILNGNNFSFRP